MDRITELLNDRTTITRKQIADLLHVNIGTVNQWGRFGYLPDPVTPGEKPLQYVTAEVVQREVDLVYSKLRHIADDGTPVMPYSDESVGIPAGCYGSAAMARIRGITTNNLHQQVQKGNEHPPHVAPSGAWYWTHEQAESAPPKATAPVGAPRWDDVVPANVGGDVYSRRHLMQVAGCSAATWNRLVKEGTIPRPHFYGRYQFWRGDGLAAAQRFHDLTQEQHHA
jgi:hypothetical protein